MRVIDATVGGVPLDFGLARAVAELLAARAGGSVMLLAWFDGKAGKGYPEARECTGKPGWLAYAESRGGSIRVNINRDEFVFVYAPEA